LPLFYGWLALSGSSVTGALVTEKNHKANLGLSENPKNHTKIANIVTFSVDKFLSKKI
jgi:hypothetical protein